MLCVCTVKPPNKGHFGDGPDTHSHRARRDHLWAEGYEKGGAVAPPLLNAGGLSPSSFSHATHAPFLTRLPPFSQLAPTPLIGDTENPTFQFVTDEDLQLDVNSAVPPAVVALCVLTMNMNIHVVGVHCMNFCGQNCGCD